jgi:hypothetical protein
VRGLQQRIEFPFFPFSFSFFFLKKKGGGELVVVAVDGDKKSFQRDIDKI